MKLIPLSKQGKNKGKYFAQIDDEDYDFLMQWRWYVKINKGLFYARRFSYEITNNRIEILMHRIIMNCPVQKLIDHKDRNGLNNQKSNLRICTQSQNTMNATVRKNKTSKYKGVYWNRKNKRWTVNININKKRKHVGVFLKENDAGLAYNEAAKKYFGEFANPNKIN